MTAPPPTEATHAETPSPSRTLRPWVPKLASLMDTRFRIPGLGIRFGLDPVIGLLPVAGDTITMLIGLAMVSEARRLGLGKRVMGRMVGNLALDWVLGLVPGLDLILDTAFKAHVRNARILAEASERQGSPPSADRSSAAAGDGWAVPS